MYRAFHVLDDVVDWYFYRDREQSLKLSRQSYADVDDKRTQTFWGNLGWCHEYSPCRLLSALVAIAWIGWVVLLALLGITLAHTFVNRAWTDPMHGHSYPRDSFVPPQESEYRHSRF